MIDFRNITKTFVMGETHFQALKGINIRIDEGELVAIVGESGSGKSTTMHIMGLLDRPTQGEYYLNHREVSSLTDNERAEIRNRQIGFIFQQFFLLPSFTALENVELPLTYRRLDSALIKERALTMLKKVEIDHHAHHKPHELSGGQQQRVAIARALVGEPKIILADEPTGALDSKTTHEILNLLVDLNQKNGVTVVMITHNLEVAKRCSRVIRIRDGLIVNET